MGKDEKSGDNMEDNDKSGDNMVEDESQETIWGRMTNQKTICREDDKSGDTMGEDD